MVTIMVVSPIGISVLDSYRYSGFSVFRFFGIPVILAWSKQDALDGRRNRRRVGEARRDRQAFTFATLQA
ncbi:hypothetical protein AAAX09_10010, partial [Bifidobacterium longum]|uniref:hypothetical protein n=1 Tax=Bifidobacterium longum TaxID=216816 RepID=UPI0032C16D86